jgi:hypothetical protein
MAIPASLSGIPGDWSTLICRIDPNKSGRTERPADRLGQTGGARHAKEAVAQNGSSFQENGLFFFCGPRKKTAAPCSRANSRRQPGQ